MKHTKHIVLQYRPYFNLGIADMYDKKNTMKLSGYQADHYTLLESTKILVVFALFVALMPMYFLSYYI